MGNPFILKKILSILSMFKFVSDYFKVDHILINLRRNSLSRSFISIILSFDNRFEKEVCPRICGSYF